MRTDVLISMQILHVCCARQHDAAFFTCAAEERGKTQTCWTYESIFCYHFCACKCRGSCFCRLTKPLRAQTIQSSPTLPVSGARMHDSLAHVHFFIFFFFSQAQRRLELITYFERFMSYYRNHNYSLT